LCPLKCTTVQSATAEHYKIRKSTQTIFCSGFFIGINLEESGLVHISQLKAGFVSDVNEVVKLHQHVQVKVVEVDEALKRIQLTMVL